MKNQSNYNKNYKNINDVIDIISNIRSTKAELNIKPKLYCDIIFSNKSKYLRKIIQENQDIIKQVARINSLLDNEIENKNTIEILLLNEKLMLRFNEEIDINSQKNRISEKINVLNTKISNLRKKLQNKAYLKNAPKDIVGNDKELLRDLMIEENKLRSIVSSIN